MRCSKNEILVKDPEVGQFPSTYWSGDEYLCPKCGHVVITGFGKSMIGLVKGSTPADHDPADALEFSWNATDMEHK
jgi:hypothetical protein